MSHFPLSLVPASKTKGDPVDTKGELDQKQKGKAENTDATVPLLFLSIMLVKSKRG
jgi:hypothetical protein